MRGQLPCLKVSKKEVTDYQLPDAERLSLTFLVRHGLWKARKTYEKISDVDLRLFTHSQAMYYPPEIDFL